MLEQIGHVVMVVRDLTACRALYGGELGLAEIGQGMGADGREMCMFSIGPSILEIQATGNAVAVIDVSEHEPRRIPSAKWRELIKKVWEADPLLCPKCSRKMRIVALIDDREVIERILRHLGLWVQGVRVFPARAPPEAAEWVIEPCYDDPFPCLPRRSEAKTGLRHRTGYGVGERLSPRARSGLPPNGDFPASAPFRAVRSGLEPPGRASTLLLDPSSPVTYPSHHDIASSDRSQRASARTTRKAISYQFPCQMNVGVLDPVNHGHVQQVDGVTADIAYFPLPAAEDPNQSGNDPVSGQETCRVPRGGIFEHHDAQCVDQHETRERPKAAGIHHTSVFHPSLIQCFSVRWQTQAGPERIGSVYHFTPDSQ